MTAKKKKKRKPSGYAARPWLKLVPRPSEKASDKVRLYMPDGSRVTLDEQVTATQLRMALDEAATLTVTVIDPIGMIGTLRLSDQSERQLLAGIDVGWRGVMWRLARVERSNDGWTLTCEDRIAAYLRSHKRRVTASRAAVTRAQFVHRLALGVKAGGGIRCYIPELLERQGIYKAETAGATKTKKNASSATEDGIATGAASSTGWGSVGGQVKVKSAGASSDQLKAIDAVLTEAGRLGASQRVMTACVMCITQESNAGDPSVKGHGDAVRSDTVGTFQQGPEWISRAKVMDDTYATRAFLLGHEAGVGGTDRGKRGWKQHFGSLNASGGDLGAMVFQVQRGGAGAGKWESEARNTVGLWLSRNQGVGGEADSEEGRSYRGQYRFSTSGDGGAQNWWDAMGSLADEVQWHRWAVANTLGYATDREMIRQNAVWSITRGKPEIHDLSWSWDYRREASELTVTVALKDPFALLPGMVAMVDDEQPIAGRWLVDTIDVDPLRSSIADVGLRRVGAKLLEPAPEMKESGKSTIGGKDEYATSKVGTITTEGGARGIVDQVAQLAAEVGGEGVYVGSDYRPGSITTTNNPSDHSGNDASRAARDIGVRGIDLLVGPPSPRLDSACVAIGRAFGRTGYGTGVSGPFQGADTFTWRGYRIQIIWRTKEWGGHMGHIHVGARKA